MVRDAARPIAPGETIKAQMRRAWAELGRPPMWRVRAAWYGEAGSWTAAAFEDLRMRSRAFCARQEARAHERADLCRAAMAAHRESLAASRPVVHRELVDAAIAVLDGAIGTGLERSAGDRTGAFQAD